MLNIEVPVSRTARVDLYWLPLGAGGHFVRLNVRRDGVRVSSSRRDHRMLGPSR
jgi:hypothetical protein